MTKKYARSQIVAAAVAVSLLACGCAHKVNNSWPKDVNLTYRAVVTNEPPDADSLARLNAYYRAMQDLVGLADLEGQFIGCIGCARLSASPPPDELTFIFFREHRVDLYAFIAAWERVQASPIGSRVFTLRFDTKPPPSAACTHPPPACYPISSCVSTDSCDADKSQQFCQKCPP